MLKRFWNVGSLEIRVHRYYYRIKWSDNILKCHNWQFKEVYYSLRNFAIYFYQLPTVNLSLYHWVYTSWKLLLISIENNLSQLCLNSSSGHWSWATAVFVFQQRCNSCFYDNFHTFKMIKNTFWQPVTTTFLLLAPHTKDRQTALSLGQQ